MAFIDNQGQYWKIRKSINTYPSNITTLVFDVRKSKTSMIDSKTSKININSNERDTLLEFYLKVKKHSYFRSMKEDLTTEQQSLYSAKIKAVNEEIVAEDLAQKALAIYNKEQLKINPPENI